MAKVLMKGNEALGAAAIKAGCRYFFGYPITPQNEVPEYMAREMPKAGGVFVQAESEVAAINMVYGAASTGARVMTSSSSPGISLKQEGLSYIAAAELPCLIVNMMRSGPGLGGIQPSQADYFQATRGGGNGDYYMPVFAPASVQELVDLVPLSFDLADEYRTPVMILGDGMIGQIMESVEFHEAPPRPLPSKEDWITVGTGEKRSPHIVNTLRIVPEVLEKFLNGYFNKLETIKQKECRWEEYGLEGAEIVLVAYGTTSRIVKSALASLAGEGIKAGLIRPITLWPYPQRAFDRIPPSAKALMSVEMSAGQMLDDVKIASAGRWPVHFFGRSGGMVPTPGEVAGAVKQLLGDRE
ncbi:MAG: 3-methyl-2-oxobutanoate dehydrogenase subunit VorB [Spirochaetales bacterium]|jgi:2-oxoglutarate ferredoxin oxidoreductase subunit alpha|nr:3-methyl-2-oxobutanoate dehydrogenase subunit VorB [Spirochaetales bacterium]